MAHAVVPRLSHYRRDSPLVYGLAHWRFSESRSNRCSARARLLCCTIHSYWSLVLVVSATSFSRSGVADFLLQRVSAVVLAVYSGCIVWCVLVHPDLEYADWVAYVRSPAMVLLGTLLLLSWGIHSWIGMWTVGTDYLNEHHIGKFATVIRLVYQFGVISLIVVYLVLGLVIIW